MVTPLVIMVHVDKLHPNPDNPRFEAGDVTELAASIRSQGIKVAIIARPADDEFGKGHYIIEDGYRRWVAARTVLEMVPVNVTVPDAQENLAVRELITALTTTLHQKDLTPMEKARAYGRLRDEAHLSQEQISRMLGVHPTSVSRFLSLLELTPSFQKSVEAGKTTVERAIKVVKKQRDIQRKNKGHKPANVGWEPDHFTSRHALAKSAQALCDAREHTGRRRLGDIACGHCWETAIRRDQMNVDSVSAREAGFDVPFIPPLLANGKAHGNQKSLRDIHARWAHLACARRHCIFLILESVLPDPPSWQVLLRWMLDEDACHHDVQASNE